MDARYPERWLNDRRILRLSDRNYRVFFTALAWSVSNRTDGHLERDDLSLIPGAEEAAAVLVRAGLWEQQDAGFVITDYLTTQTSRDQMAVLETKRRNDRDAQARKRARDKQNPHPPDSQPDRQPDVSVTDQADDKGKDRPGRQGQEGLSAVPSIENGWPPSCPDCGLPFDAPGHRQTCEREAS